ncbi:MAG TPA: PadR family transcriptional regulator [Micromonosporaceae bacterium]
MTAVFSHGRLRLYLLKLLNEGPKHGYELIRLLENRFLGLYAPSAGTIYPRLQRMEAEGLVTRRQAGGRKVYEITDTGRAELSARADELASLESEIHASVADLASLANEIQDEVSGSVRDLKRELRQAAQQARPPLVDKPWRQPKRPWWEQPDIAPSRRRETSGDQAEEAASSPDAAELERLGAEVRAEATRLARRPDLRPAELRTAAAVLTSTLTELRRLLGR